MKLEKNIVKEVTEILNPLFPRARGRHGLIVIPGAREKEEFRFSFKYYEYGMLGTEYVLGESMTGGAQEIAGATPTEIAKRIIEATKTMPGKSREYQGMIDRYQEQEREASACY